MPIFWDTLKTNIINPVQQGVQSVGKTLGDIFKPVQTTASNLFKPIAELTKQSEYAIPGDKGGSYKPYENLWVETAAQTFGVGARESGFWERLPGATYGSIVGFGAGVGKAITFGWWDPEVKFENDAADMAFDMSKTFGDIWGNVASFLVGGAVVKGALKGIPLLGRVARIAPKTYSLLTEGITFAGLGQLQKDEFYKDASQRVKDFGADFALGGAFSIAGMKPNYFKSTGIIAPAAYVNSLIKGDTPEDALKNTAAMVTLHSVNYAVAKAFPSRAAQIEKNMEKAAQEQLRITKQQSLAYLGVDAKATPEQIKTAWKQKVVGITKAFPAQAQQTPQQAGQFNQAWNTANRAYEFLAKVQNPTGYTGKTFKQEFNDLFYELWVKVPDKRALVLSTIRNMPAGLSIRPALTPNQKTEIVKALGGENADTKLGKVNILSDSDLVSIAKEQNIKVTPSKQELTAKVDLPAEQTPAAPTTERTEIWSLPGDLMPVRGKPTWKHSKMLWNTMRNQYGQPNTWGRDITANKGAVSWIIDTLENGLASKKDLMTEARKTKGVRMDTHQYKKLYAMFKSRDYDIEGYKKVMSTLKGIKPAVVEKTIGAAPEAQPSAQIAPQPEPEIQPTEGFQFDSDSSAKQGKVTVKDPALFEKGTIFRQKGKVAGVSYLMGKNTQTSNTEAQAIYFDKKLFTETEAAKWWTKNGDKFTKPWSVKEEKLPAAPKPAPAPETKPAEAPQTLYHGTTAENAELIRKEGFKVMPPVHGKQVIGQGVYLTPTKAEAQNFGQEVLEVTLKPETKIMKLKDVGEYTQLWRKVAQEAGAFGGKEVDMDKAMKDYVQAQGYGGIEVPGFGNKGETYISVFDPANLETKVKPAAPAKPVKKEFTKAEIRADKADQIRKKYLSPEEKELDEAERVPSVGEILKSEDYLKKFKARMEGKVKAPKGARADELATPPSGSPPRPPKEESIGQVPPPPAGSGLEAIDAMVGKLSKTQTVGTWLKGLKPAFSRLFTDRFAAMKKFEEDISKMQGQPIDINSSPYVGARLYAGRFGTIEANFRDLQNIVTPVRKLKADFTRYVLAERAIERADRGFDNPAGVTKETGEQALTELKIKVGDKAYKQFEQAGQAIQNWSVRAILEPMRDTGLISKKAFEAIVEKNKHWMPFHVLDYLPDVQQADKMPVGSETFSVSKQGVVKGLQGTEKTIRDPFESILDNLSKAVSLTKRNEVARKLIELRKTHPEAKEFIKYLHGDAKPPKDWDTINVFINGKSTRWAVPKELSDAMHAMSPAEAGLLGKLVLASNKAFKAGTTTLYIPFTLSNAIRDYQTATIVNKWGFNPVNWLSGFKDGIKGAFKWESKAYDDFMRNQGGYGGYIENAKQLSTSAKELFTPTWWTKTKAVVNPFNLISNFAEAIELAPRLGIYKKGIAKPGVTTTEAAFEARNATVDFAKAGAEMRIINQWIPFVNARWQGLLRAKDAFKEHPFKSAMKTMALIVAPGIATYFYNILNHEDLWDDIPQWAKDQYFIVILGSEKDADGKTVPKVLQIPKGDMGQIFFNPLMYAFEYVRTQEPQNLFKLALEWTSQISPIPFTRDGELSASSFFAGALPPIFKTPLEIATNMNLFTGFPIIPQRLQKVAPTEQYNERTEPLAILAGRALGASPMKISHAINGLLGSSSRYFLNPADVLGASVERFVRTQGGAKERQAWALKDEAEMGYNTTRIYVRRALEAGNLQEAQQLAAEWNKRAETIVPRIVPYIAQEDPKEAASFMKKVTFASEDLKRLLNQTPPSQGGQRQTLPPGNEPIKNFLLRGVPQPIAPEPSDEIPSPTLGEKFPAGQMKNEVRNFLMKGAP